MPLLDYIGNGSPSSRGVHGRDNRQEEWLKTPMGSTANPHGEKGGDTARLAIRPTIRDRKILSIEGKSPRTKYP